MYQDKTGMIFLDFTHVFGFLGNIFFALKKVKNLFQVPSQAYGWFYRGMGAHMSLQRLTTEKETIKSHPVAWSLVAPILLIGVSLMWFFASIDFFVLVNNIIECVKNRGWDIGIG
jgi:hypothetical protein